MSKGSIRQKGNKWYYRFYVENESGQHIQKEFAGSKSKRETEAMLRHALEEYENHNYVPSAGNMTVGQLLDLWIEDVTKSGVKSNGTIMLYQNTVNRIKTHPISQRKLKTVSSDHLQNYLDELCFRGNGEENNCKSLAASTIRAYKAVLQGAFKFAVFPKKLLSCNPMEYVVQRDTQTAPVLFQTCTEEKKNTITHSQFKKLCKYLKDHPTLLPVQIAYYTGLRVGEICALTWEDIHLDEGYLLIQRTIYYNNVTHHIEMNAPKGNKCRIVDFGNTLANILRETRKKQFAENNSRFGAKYHNYYRVISKSNRKHYEIYSFPADQQPSDEFQLLHFVCCKHNGTCLTPDYIGYKCRKISRELDGFSGFHFHMLRHTFTSNLIQNGASPKEVQELLGHSDVKLTMNIYAHSTREAKRASVKLLDELPADQPI